MLNIPNKSHFKLNEVCSITTVKPYVLRFWESEFEQISPTVSASGQKLYEHKDIEAIALIKSLLFDKKLNIEEAKRELTLNTFSEDTVEESEVSKDFVVSRNSLSESDINDLLQAKTTLHSLIAKVSDLKEGHSWI